MTVKLGLQTPKNTSNLVADTLRSAILQGKLRTGQSLKQDEIAAELDVSKIPVREALVQLQAEGLVELRQNRGAIVSKLSVNEINEIYIIRHALETLALENAIPNMEEGDFVQIAHILDCIDVETDHSKWVELNWQFHHALYRPSRMPHLIKTVHDLHNNVVRFFSAHPLGSDHLATSQREHRDLLALSRAGDIPGALELLRQHLTYPMSLFADDRE